MILPAPGEMTERIDIINVAPPYNQEMKGTQTSVAAANLWAKIEPLGGSVDIDSNQVQTATQQYRIWIRRPANYQGEFTPWQQLKWGAKQLAITGPIENLQTRFLLIHAQERTSKRV